DQLVLIARVRAQCADGTAERIRTLAGLSCREIGDALGVHGESVRRWETGRTRPPAREALVYRVSVRYRATNSGTPPAPSATTTPGDRPASTHSPEPGRAGI